MIKSTALSSLYLAVLTAAILAVATDAVHGAKADTPIVTKENLDQHMLAKTRELLDVLKDNKDLLEEDYDTFYKIVDGQIATWVDTERLARGIMGRHFKAATPEEVDAFIMTIQNTLLDTYDGVLEQLVIDSLTLAKSKPAKGKKSKKQKNKKDQKRVSDRPNRAKVLLSITLITGQTFGLQYSVAKDDNDQWRIYNIIVGGVNLGLTYRSQFYSAMHDPANEGKITKVIEGWEGDFVGSSLPGSEEDNETGS